MRSPADALSSRKIACCSGVSFFQAMAQTVYGDGYIIARTLERRWGWEPDAQLVEILDGGQSSYALTQAQAKVHVLIPVVKCRIEATKVVEITAPDEHAGSRYRRDQSPAINGRVILCSLRSSPDGLPVTPADSV